MGGALVKVYINAHSTEYAMNYLRMIWSPEAFYAAVAGTVLTKKGNNDCENTDC